MVHDPLRGMTREQRAQFDRLPAAMQRAYTAWRDERPNRASAHRDDLPAFVAGWRAREATARRRA